MRAINVCAALFTTPPPTPAESLTQRIRELTGHLILYTRFPGYVMLGDADSGASVWLSAAVCPAQRTIGAAAEWSHDGRYIAFTCQDIDQRGATYLLDLQTADIRQLAAGDAVEFEWSPHGSRLLVAEQTASQRGYILDATSGVTATLPAAPLWVKMSYPPQLASDMLPGYWSPGGGMAAMAWSGDGTKVAVIADQLYILDTDPQHPTAAVVPILASWPRTSISKPLWSSDSRYVYIILPRKNHNDPLAPSSMFGVATYQLELATGAITATDTVETSITPATHDVGSTPNSSDGKLFAAITAENEQRVVIYNQQGLERRHFEGNFAQWQPRSIN